MIKVMKAAHFVGNCGDDKMMVEEGQVVVNEVVESRKRMKLRPGDVVEYNSQKIEIQDATK